MLRFTLNSIFFTQLLTRLGFHSWELSSITFSRHLSLFNSFNCSYDWVLPLAFFFFCQESISGIAVLQGLIIKDPDANSQFYSCLQTTPTNEFIFLLQYLHGVIQLDYLPDPLSSLNRFLDKARMDFELLCIVNIVF